MSKPIPGYGGLVAPSCRPELQLKTMVNERMPLCQRIKSIQTISPKYSETPEPVQSYFIQKRHVGHTTYSESSTSLVKSAADVPPRAKERVGDGATSLAPFTATTTQRAAVNYVHGDEPDFFSRVRAIERVDDDNRHSLDEPRTRNGAAKNLRCAAIQVKRETNPAFAPTPQTFDRIQRAKSCAPLRDESEVSKFAHIPPRSSNQIDFEIPTEVAARAKTVLIAKEGSCLAPDRALVQNATAADLFAGTSKAREEVVSGFMGHVPADPRNTEKINGSQKEHLRQFSKTFVTVTQPTMNSTAKLMMRGNQDPLTVGSRMLRQSAVATEERQMNVNECGRKNAVRGFFTAGLGDQDNVVADQFCVRFRPLEGMMKHGTPANSGWISDHDLRVGARLN